MKEKRRDNKGRILHTGESQRTDEFVFDDVTAKADRKDVFTEGPWCVHAATESKIGRASCRERVSSPV